MIRGDKGILFPRMPVKCYSKELIFGGLMKQNRAALLQTYERLLTQVASHYPMTQVHEDIHRLAPEKTTESARTVALVALTHGDEMIGLPLLIQWLGGLLTQSFSLKAPIYLILANRPAFQQDVRYVGTDLNRSYGQNDATTWEGKRAGIIEHVVDDCDDIIDLHQCIEETATPFFLLPYAKASHAWVKRVAPQIPVIIRKNIKAPSTLASYGFLKGKRAVTFEVGSKGMDPYQLALGTETIQRFLDDAWHGECHEKSWLPVAPDYEIKHFAPYDKGQVVFEKPLKNFDPIEQDQVIARVEGRPVATPMAGHILLYPKKWFNDDSPIKADGLFFVLQKTN